MKDITRDLMFKKERNKKEWKWVGNILNERE